MNLNIDEQTVTLRTKLNMETSRMAWKELLRYFAGGTVVAVSAELDLVDVAVCFTNDDKEAVAQWMNDKKIEKVSDAQALAWLDEDATLWSVVVRPWVLVQYKKDAVLS